MIAWIKKIFLGEDSVSLPYEPSQEVPDEIITPNPTEGVGEPVLSFVECVRDNPRRFRVIKKYPSIIMLDLLEGINYQINLNYEYSHLVGGLRIDNLRVGGLYTHAFSREELYYLLTQIRSIYYKRLRTIHELRKTRLRAKLSKVYYNEK
jgi:hypothetical protein